MNTARWKAGGGGRVGDLPLREDHWMVTAMVWE